MKKSELKSYIKEMIVSELTEVDTDKTRGTVVMPKTTNPTDIKKLTAQGVDIELKEEDMDDAEPTASDIAANASIAKLKSKYEEVTKQMKAVVNKYKSAEGAEKQKYVDQLKGLTKLKKEIEAMINPTADEEED
jgi:galactitol-specific phosphotransferase system IIB component